VGPVRALPIAYLQLPATASLAPQTSTVLAVLFQVCENVKDQLQKATRSKEDFPTINTLEAVLDTVKLRLCNQVQANTLSGGMAALLKAADQLEASLFSTIAQSIGQSKLDREIDRLGRLLNRRSDLKDLAKRIKAADSGPAGMPDESLDTDGLEWLGWQKRPTLGWLMSGAWHRTEGLKAFYASEKEYAETLLRVWSLLTFYWGSGSVWPRCQHRQQGHGEGSACGEPLLAGGGGSEARCRRRNCGGVAVWRCYRAGHDGVCEECLAGQQELLVGEPGLGASTDVYDGVVDKEVARREESVYLLRGMASRRPPKVAPNWKTSKFCRIWSLFTAS